MGVYPIILRYQRMKSFAETSSIFQAKDSVRGTANLSKYSVPLMIFSTSKKTVSTNYVF